MFRSFTRASSPRGLFALLAAAALAACAPTDVLQSPAVSSTARRNLTAGGGVVISQVYGGGGNTGATYTNDFIELFNNSNTPTSVNGWSVQYASATGSTWQVTALPNVTLQPGQYLLVQQAVGAGGTTALPTADAVGTIPMSATAGKVALVSNTTALNVVCPTANIVDFVGFGTTANCVMSSSGPVTATTTVLPTPAPSNTNAVLRKNGGATDSNNNNSDFAAGAPNPRNTGSPFGTPGGGSGGTPTPQVSVQLSPASVVNGAQATATASVTLSGSAVTFTNLSWSTSNSNAAIVDATANPAILIAQATGTTIVTASVQVNGQSYSGTATLTITAPAVGTMSVSSRSAYLPVGFQTQLFVSGNNATGVAQNNQSVTWSTNNPAVTVDANGVITAASAGTARVIATAADGSSAFTTILTQVAPLGGSNVRTGFNTALGLPTDDDPSDDVIIARRQYTLSYNPRRGVANWSAWNLDATHTGGSARCNCFTLDTALTRLGYQGTTTNDWINNGEYSRGHLAPSADWTVADGDNAPTFFLTNMLPQKQEMNAGPWGAFENFLRTQLTGGREVYIIAGGIWTKDRSGPGIDGFGMMNGNRIAIPDSMWKIAVVVPDTRAAGEILDPTQVQVYAVNMPNIAAVQSSYTAYLTTVDKIQRSTGYDFLSLIPGNVQCALEQRSCGPTAAFSAPASAVVGTPVAVDASATQNPSGAALTYSWDFGNGTTGSGVNASVTYAAAGTYTITLTVSDGLTSSSSTRTIVVSPGAMTATIVPNVGGWSAGQAVTLRVGQQLIMAGSATDPAAKSPYRLTWAYGDGTGFATTSSAIPTSSRPMNRAKTWTAAGQYVVTFTVLNSVGSSATASLVVNVTP
jgi:DNA/RNA endonuclease G (NUC1)